MRRYELSDEQWDKIKCYFETPNKKGRAYKNVRNTVNGIIWILRSGASWRDLKKELIGKSRGGSTTKAGS